MILFIKKILRGKRAFSIIELIIACIIIGVLISLAVPWFMTARLRAEEAKAMATLYAYANAQKAFWFEAQGTPSDPNTYTSEIDELMPFVDVLSASGHDDGDWRYSTTGDADTFTVTARHLNVFGAQDDLELVLHENGQVDRIGAWPY